MSKFTMLLERIEQQAIRIHELEHERQTEREAADNHVADWGRKYAELQAEIAQLKRYRSADSFARVSYAYEEVRRVILNAHSLIERRDLSDSETARSIHGLIDQVMGTEWFSTSLHNPNALAGQKPPRRVPKPKPKQPDPTADDAPEHGTPDS